MELNPSNAILCERRVYNNSSCYVYHFKCIECKDNIIKVERKYLKNTSGKCRFCSHKGVPFLGTYNYFIDSVKRTNSKRKKQKEINLSFEEFLDFTKINNCHYCNKKLIWNKHVSKGNHRTNLDKKDSNKGYSKDNCVVCCKECNYIKGNHFSYEEFLEVVKLLDKMRGNFIERTN
jgi:hypothetical protein